MKSKRILIVDDEESILAIVKLSLEMNAGWEVLTATTGMKGIEMAKAKHPDAILLDMMMPEMDGISTFKHLHSDSQTQNIPVIVLTAKVRGGKANGVLDLNIAGSIIKPFDVLMLPENINSILNWSS